MFSIENDICGSNRTFTDVLKTTSYIIRSMRKSPSTLILMMLHYFTYMEVPVHYY